MDYANLLGGAQHTWLITGVAGFIGSNLLEALLRADQQVRGLDNFSTGHQANLEEVRAAVTPAQWERFTLLREDIRDLEACRAACQGVEFVLHQAALGSVPRSIEDPLATHGSNLTGFLDMLMAAKEAGVRTFVYAASSSTYGDHPGLPKVEDVIGAPLSPYAVTKLANELYAQVYTRLHGLRTVGLRYFNVFGPRQDPNGAYAAVIPAWFKALIHGEPAYINGDGETSRDFCHVDNVVQANIRAALASDAAAQGQIYNVALGNRTTLNELYSFIRQRVAGAYPAAATAEPVYRPFRAGDVRHSLADIGKARNMLGFAPSVEVAQGLDASAQWYLQRLGGR